MNKAGPATDGASHVNRFGELRPRTSLLQGGRGVGLDAVGALDRVGNGNFPYIVSSDNYNAIILPADYAGDFEKTFVGTGPFKLDKYTAKVGAITLSTLGICRIRATG